MTPDVTTSPSTAPRSEGGLPWTEMHDEQLRRLARANIPLQVIGFRLGRDPDAVSRRAEQLGVEVIDRVSSLSG